MGFSFHYIYIIRVQLLEPTFSALVYIPRWCKKIIHPSAVTTSFVCVVVWNFPLYLLFQKLEFAAKIVVAQLSTNIVKPLLFASSRKVRVLFPVFFYFFWWCCFHFAFVYKT